MAAVGTSTKQLLLQGRRKLGENRGANLSLTFLRQRSKGVGRTQGSYSVNNSIKNSVISYVKDNSDGMTARTPQRKQSCSIACHEAPNSSGISLGHPSLVYLLKAGSEGVACSHAAARMGIPCFGPSIVISGLWSVVKVKLQP